MCVQYNLAITKPEYQIIGGNNWKKTHMQKYQIWDTNYMLCHNEPIPMISLNEWILRSFSAGLTKDHHTLQSVSMTITDIGGYFINYIIKKIKDIFLRASFVL